MVANAAVGGDRLVDEVVKRIGDPETAKAMIVSPARVSSPLDLAAGDVDDDIEAARGRLDAAVQALRQRGVDASGEVGEAEPELALHDALVKFPADEAIVVAHPDESSTWLEKDMLERMRRQVTIPIAYIEVDPHGDTSTVKEVHDVAPLGRQAAAAERADEFETDYLPPMSARDRFALALGPLGTLALFLLASTCRGELVHDFSGDAGCVTIALLAIFGFLITAVHVPMLLLLRSGSQTGTGRLAGFVSNLIYVYFIPALLVAAVIALLN